MRFPLSAGVVYEERDLSTVVPSVATTGGGFVGTFKWGPVKERRLIEDENALVQQFGKSYDDTYTSFFTAADFLSFGNNLQVVRVVGEAALNASSDTEGLQIHNEDHFHEQTETTASFYAKYPSSLGNSLQVIAVDESSFANLDENLAGIFTAAPTGDEIHVAIIDEDGDFTGSAGEILEKYEFLSKTVGALSFDGSIAYYKTLLNNKSRYVWATGNLDDVVDGIVSLEGGVDDNDVEDGDKQAGYDLFKNADKVDISLLPTGDASETIQNYVLSNIADTRRDIVAFVSPVRSAVINNTDNEVTGVKTWADNLPSTSYGATDSGWYYRYDRYNDLYRWVPLNGQHAGLYARTDSLAAPWFSGAGLNRGQLKNVKRLAFDPDKTDRDVLYPARVNPVVDFDGQGTVMWGDKTLLSRPSSFDRINVRRLFIVLEKSIAKAAKYSLFENNDQFTRAQFRNLVEPYLRNIKGQGGIIEYRVVCDETNNTGEVKARNEFVGDIFIKPPNSINFIKLNFKSVRNDVSFDEVIAA